MSNMVGTGVLDLLQQYVAIISGMAQIAIVFLLWRTVRDFGETGKVSRIQVEHRFRPWVGPSSGIEYVRTVNGQHQYAISVKNFGEVPASKVTALFTMKNDAIPTRDILFSDGSISKFSLGPLLPSMEKRYWIFIDSELIQKGKDNKTQIFTALYFAYEFSKERSGYGMISVLDTKTDLFVHKDMWIQ
jgi:hypothetical protein